MRLFRYKRTLELFISEEGGAVWSYLNLALFMSGRLGPKRSGWGAGRRSHYFSQVVRRGENNNADSTLNEARYVKLVTRISGMQ